MNITDPSTDKVNFIPMAINPALVLFDSDLDSVAEFTLGDLDSSIFASLGSAASAIVWRGLCSVVSFDGDCDLE